MINFDKPVQTREGREVIIWTTTAQGNYCVRGEIRGMANRTFEWTLNGEVYAGTWRYGLMNAPAKKRKIFVNVYPEYDRDVAYRTCNDAHKNAVDGRLTCIELEYEVPSGD
jgi:hypothetical protein